MTGIDHSRWADYLIGAADDRREVAAIAAQIDGGLSIEDGYAIQAALLEKHLARGDGVAGAKLGLTSAAKQEQMGVSEPCYGWVLESSVARAAGPAPVDVAVGELIHPRAEPELIFVLGQDLAGPGATASDVLDATARGGRGDRADRLPVRGVLVHPGRRDRRQHLGRPDGGRTRRDRPPRRRSHHAGLRVRGGRPDHRHRPPARRCWETRPPAWPCWPTIWPARASPSRRDGSSRPERRATPGP